jgi:hypothetical protein
MKNKKSTTTFVVRITKPDGEVKRLDSAIKRKILNYSKLEYSKNDVIYLRVNYNIKKPEIINEGKYNNWKDFLNAWKSFTDKDLIKDALTY